MIDAGAKFSDDRMYRYYLWRIWNPDKPLVMFIGLNPSTAAESKNDNTITKVIKIANNNGFGGVYMCNLFAVVSPYPEVLKAHPDPLGQNDLHLADIAAKCKSIVFAWGGFPEAVDRARNCLGVVIVESGTFTKEEIDEVIEKRDWYPEAFYDWAAEKGFRYSKGILGYSYWNKYFSGGSSYSVEQLYHVWKEYPTKFDHYPPK